MLIHKEVIHECGGSNITVEEYLSIDSALDELSLATDEEIISQVQEEINGTAKQVEEKEMEEPVPVQLASEAESVSALKKLNLWCQFREQDSGSHLTFLSQLERDVRRIESARKAQKPITDLFSKVTDSQTSAQVSGSSTDNTIVVDDPDTIIVGDDNEIEQ